MRGTPKLIATLLGLASYVSLVGAIYSMDAHVASKLFLAGLLHALLACFTAAAAIEL